MKENVLETLKTMGFEIEDLQFGYGFEYEDKHYLFLPQDNDENFLSIALPAVMDIDDDEHVGNYRLMDELNSSMKYVKATRINDNVWLFYERQLFGNEDMEQMLSAMIMALEATVNKLHNQLQKLMDDDDDDSDDGEAVVDADAEEVA